MAEEREKAAAVALIEKAVDSTAAEVDPRLLKAIKSVVRNSDSELRFASQTLMSLMKRNHSQVRLYQNMNHRRDILSSNWLSECLDEL